MSDERGEGAREAGSRSNEAPSDASRSNEAQARDAEASGAELESLGGPELILVRYGEIALKGGNRGHFERKLAQNIKRAAKSISSLVATRSHGRITLQPERRGMAVARRVREVFGVKSVSPGWGCEPTPDAIVALARRVMADEMRGREGAERTFRVRSKRADKRFPLHSHQLDRHVAEHVLEPYPGLRVRLDEADLTLGIEVRDERAYVFLQRFEGPGGLPVGTLGKGLCLLSGGIDSPVAAWLAMKRGLETAFVSFHSAPFLGEGSKKKVTDLARALSRYQPRTRLFVVPFAESQIAIRDSAPPAYRTVLYRRMMNRIATRLAKAHEMSALVTGESLGQVASQTLENMTCIEDASGLPIIRPLVCFDKEEAIAIARRIGTFELSNVPEPDCCTVFQPDRPVIRGRVVECELAEAELDVEGLLERAVAGVEVLYPGDER